MKIPFDIKYRPQIESGEYKVVTREGRFATIGIWQMKAPKPLVGCYQYDDDGNEKSGCWYDNGSYSDVNEHPYDLFLVTPEPELTEFEATLLSYLSDDTSGELDKETMHKCVKVRAEELLAIAKKEICNDCAANLKSYIKGRQDALKEMEENRVVYKHEGPVMPTYYPCSYGGACTNPFHDCINCPMQSTGISTNTGTSTAKVEGKE